MKVDHIVSLLQDNFGVATVCFDWGGNGYSYKYRGNLNPGDKVIVDTPSNGLTVAVVVEVDTDPIIRTDVEWSYTWIVQRIDTTEYEATLKAEAEFRKTIKQLEQLKKREQLRQDLKERYIQDTTIGDAFIKAVDKLNGAGS